MQHRILMPRDGRGRKSGSSSNLTGLSDPTALQQYYTQLQQAYASQIGATMGKLPMAYSNMSTLASMNPMYAAQLAQYNMLAGLSGGTGGDEEREEGEITKKDKEKMLKKSAAALAAAASTSSSSSSSTASPSTSSTSQAAALSQIYSQMMMNQMYAAQYANMSAGTAAASLAAATGGATSLAALAAQMQAQQLLVNGTTSNDSEDEKSVATKQLPLKKDSKKEQSSDQKNVDSGRRKKNTPKHINKLHSSSSAPQNLSLPSATKVTTSKDSQELLPQDLSIKAPVKYDKETELSKTPDYPKQSGDIVQDLSMKKSVTIEDDSSNEYMDFSTAKTSESDTT